MTKEIKYMYLDGSTKAEKRIEMVKTFNEGDTQVFLISLKAGGTGYKPNRCRYGNTF